MPHLICSICHEGNASPFTSLDELEVHIVETHYKGSNHQCKECFANFNTHYLLLVHFRAVHSMSSEQDGEITTRLKIYDTISNSVNASISAVLSKPVRDRATEEETVNNDRIALTGSSSGITNSGSLHNRNFESVPLKAESEQMPQDVTIEKAGQEREQNSRRNIHEETPAMNMSEPSDYLASTDCQPTLSLLINRQFASNKFSTKEQDMSVQEMPLRLRLRKRKAINYCDGDLNTDNELPVKRNQFRLSRNTIADEDHIVGEPTTEDGAPAKTTSMANREIGLHRARGEGI
ncbi:hypothetical protein Ddc_21942 [Ditylenchus destructor]|nr:hypothetical protein Ddc_21942 [Ditylenchus destructor]